MKQDDVIHVRQPDGSYASYHELPTWFTVTLGTIAAGVLIIGLALLFSTIAWVSETQTEFARRDAIIQACQQSERYTDPQCKWIANEWKDIR